MPDNRSSYQNHGNVAEKKPGGSSLVELKREDFYKNEKEKIVNPELFADKAEEIAGKFIRISHSQMRRLYDEVKRLDQSLFVAPDAWQEIEPYIRMVKSKVAYNVARAMVKNDRDNKDAYENLSSFVKSGIGIVKDKEDFHVFTALFEAVYGFYYEKTPKEN